MALLNASDIPLFGGAVPPTSIADETGYTAFTVAPNGKWVLGSALKGRKLLVTVQTGALGAGTTGIKLFLRKGNDANGASPAAITGADYTWEPADVADITNATLRTEIDCAYINDLTKYYSLALSVKGNGSGTLLASASAVLLEASHV